MIRCCWLRRWPRAPIRNRTVDLLLTMETLCRLSYWGRARRASGARLHGRGTGREITRDWFEPLADHRSACHSGFMPAHILPSQWSLWSDGSFLSIASSGSVLSVGSVGSAGSLFSVGSAGSIASIGSAGSIGSAISAGSISSIAASGAVCSLANRRSLNPRWTGVAVAAVSLTAVGGVLLSRCRRNSARPRGDRAHDVAGVGFEPT
jgi:hypothetical protein